MKQTNNPERPYNVYKVNDPKSIKGLENFVNPLYFGVFMQEVMKYSTLIPTEVSSGGCGIYAQAIAEQLQKRGIPFRIIAINPEKEKDNFENTVKALQNKPFDKNHLGFYHILVECYGFCYSSGMTGFYLSIDNMGDGYDYELTYEQLVSLNEMVDAWNPIFDRSLIPLLRDNIEKCFSMFENWVPGDIISSLTSRRVKLNDYTRTQLKKRAMKRIFGRILDTVHHED